MPLCILQFVYSCGNIKGELKQIVNDFQTFGITRKIIFFLGKRLDSLLDFLTLTIQVGPLLQKAIVEQIGSVN